MDNNNGFKYTYTAPTEEERREIIGIRKQYEVDNRGSKLERLRRLDARIRNIPTAISLVFGIVGLLVFGLGLALVLEWSQVAAGILCSALGVIPIALAYPAHLSLSRRCREKYAKEIIKLSDELLSASDTNSDSRDK